MPALSMYRSGYRKTLSAIYLLRLRNHASIIRLLHGFYKINMDDHLEQFEDDGLVLVAWGRTDPQFQFFLQPIVT